MLEMKAALKTRQLCAANAIASLGEFGERWRVAILVK